MRRIFGLAGRPAVPEVRLVFHVVVAGVGPSGNGAFHIGWADGSPPRFACGFSRAAVIEALEQVPAAQVLDGNPRNRCFFLTVVTSPDGRLPSVTDVLVGAARRQSGALVVAFRADCTIDPLALWNDVEAWIEALAHSLSRTQSALHLAIRIETRTPCMPQSLCTFLSQRAGWCSLSVVESEDGHSRRSDYRLDQAARIADLGVPVNARIELSRGGRQDWLRLAEQWQIITRGHGMSFTPALVGGERLVDASEFVEFLGEIYSSRRFDLWRTDPFASLLWAMCSGPVSVPRCGSDLVASATELGLIEGCRQGVPHCGRIAPRSCQCEFSTFRDVICPSCIINGEPTIAPRVSCSVAKVFVPEMLRDLADAARYQHFLQNRRPDERLRIAAVDGQVKVWSEKVILDHRNRFEGDQNGNDRHDLSWVRTRPAGIAESPSNGTAGQAEPPAIGG